MKIYICAMSIFLLLCSGTGLYAAESWQSPAKAYMGQSAENLRSAADHYFNSLFKGKNHVVAKDVLAGVEAGGEKYFNLDVRFLAEQTYTA